MHNDKISAEEHEEVMKWAHRLGHRMPYGVKTTEAPHYRRVAMQEAIRAKHGPVGEAFAKRPDFLGRAPKGVNDGDGFVFISHIGDVYPSGFLPVSCENVRETPLRD